MSGKTITAAESKNRRHVVYRPRSAADFRPHAEHPGFWEGYCDWRDGLGFRDEYQAAAQSWQLMYESGREIVADILAAGLEPPLWSSRWMSRVIWAAVDAVLEDG